MYSQYLVFYMYIKLLWLKQAIILYLCQYIYMCVCVCVRVYVQTWCSFFLIKYNQCVWIMCSLEKVSGN